MVIKNGKAYFYHKDHLGSIVAITNIVGEVVQKNQYSSFGKILSIKNKERKEIGIEGATEKSFAYTGREWDEEIDLYYYRARHYDPQVGRFMQQDPIGLMAGDTNFYRYVQNSPLNFVDPFGLTQEDLDRAFSFARKRFGSTPTYTFTRNMGTVQGYYDKSTNQIFINDRYRKELNVSDSALLLTTVYHEVLHSKYKWLMIFDDLTEETGRDDIFHEYIYTESMGKAAEDFYNYNMCGKK